MKLRRIILISAFSIIIVSCSIFLVINIIINKKIADNKKVIDNFNELFVDYELEEYSEFMYELPKLEIDGKDYVGSISIYNNELVLPVLSKCSSTYISMESACKYNDLGLVILGTNLKNSFSSYKLYNVGDTIMFTNMLGQSFQYKIEKIKRVNKIEEISFEDNDLLIIIKDYYNMEYLLLISNSY